MYCSCNDIGIKTCKNVRAASRIKLQLVAELCCSVKMRLSTLALLRLGMSRIYTLSFCGMMTGGVCLCVLLRAGLRWCSD